MLFKRFIAVLFLLSFFVSCNENKAEQPVSSKPMETEGNIDTDQESPTLVSATNIFPGLSCYDKIDGKHLDVLMAGEIVSYTGQKGENSKGHSFYEIITDENERVWTWSSYIFEDSRPGVVKPGVDSFIFSKSNENAVTSEKLDPMTIVAVDSKHKNETFSKVAWLTNDRGIKHNLYVVSGLISYNSADIKVARILNKYKNSNNEDIKKELLTNARSITGVSSDFYSYIDFLEQDEFSPDDIDLQEINETFKDSITIKEDSISTPYLESVNLEVIDADYSLLKYILFDGSYNKDDNSLSIQFTNSYISGVETIPAELSINIDDVTYYLGVVGGFPISDRGIFNIKIDTKDYLETFKGINKDLTLTLSFINNYKIEGKAKVVGGSNEN